MSTEKNGRRPKALVIGAGIGGLTAAVALREAGLDVEIHERAGQLRAAGSGLSVMSNAVGALESLGVGIDLESRGTALESYHVRTARGRLIREFPFPEIIGRLGVPSVLITRSDLQQALLEAARASHPRLRCLGFETGPTGGVRVTFEDGRVERGDLLVGADGFHSVVRRQLAGPEPSQDSGYICWLAVVPYAHPGSRPVPSSTTGAAAAGSAWSTWAAGGSTWGTKNMPAERSHGWKGSKEEILRTYAAGPTRSCTPSRSPRRSP